jgi:Spy/CpxP family protein refolding chaperone
MKRRAIIGVLAVLTGGLLTGATVLAFGGPSHRYGVMKRFASATIDDALDKASVTPTQRTVVYAARDRVFAAVEQHWQSRGGRMEEALRLFEADQIDLAHVAALRQAREDEHQQLADTVQQALVEVHDVLTPAQRKVVADYVRSHHRTACTDGRRMN